jgi:hypothetical protein
MLIDLRPTWTLNQCDAHYARVLLASSDWLHDAGLSETAWHIAWFSVYGIVHFEDGSMTPVLPTAIGPAPARLIEIARVH